MASTNKQPQWRPSRPPEDDPAMWRKKNRRRMAEQMAVTPEHLLSALPDPIRPNVPCLPPGPLDGRVAAARTTPNRDPAQGLAIASPRPDCGPILWLFDPRMLVVSGPCACGVENGRAWSRLLGKNPPKPSMARKSSRRPSAIVAAIRPSDPPAQLPSGRRIRRRFLCRPMLKIRVSSIPSAREATRPMFRIWLASIRMRGSKTPAVLLNDRRTSASITYLFPTSRSLQLLYRRSVHQGEPTTAPLFKRHRAGRQVRKNQRADQDQSEPKPCLANLNAE